MSPSNLRPAPDHPATNRILHRNVLFRAFLIGSLSGLLVVLAGCATASEATPVTTTFPFNGAILDVRSHDAATDLVASDRDDVKVTRWFATKLATGVKASWSLTDRTLDLRADCTGIANCDTRFRVEVPLGVRVLRDGQATKLDGRGGS
jgi:hypothetical protein